MGKALQQTFFKRRNTNGKRELREKMLTKRQGKTNQKYNEISLH